MTRKKIIIDYARDCINDKIKSCKKHKDACRRLLNDFKKEQNNPDYPYYWDEEEAEKIVQWFEFLRHSKGELSGTPIYLTPWQQFHLCQLYGWKKKSDKRRRFKKMFIEVSRKNAKSQELAGIALYECAITSTKNQEINEIYTAGTKRDQSKIVFSEADAMLKGSPIRKKFKITKSSITHDKSGSFIKALSKDDGKNGDGSNPSLLILDEYHQHKDTSFYDLGIGSNTKEPLLVIITTAGVDLNAPCYREYNFCSDVLDPNVDVEDDEYLIDICEQDEEEAKNPKLLLDEDLWIKSNPIRATYEAGREKIRTTFLKALKVPEDMPACLTKNFDIWLQATATGYMNMEKWKRCEIDELPFDIKGMQCVIGIDVSAKIDLSSVAITIPFLDAEDLDEEGEPVMKFIVFSHSFIPNREKLVEREITDKVPYQAWEKEGFITVTDSQIVNQKAMMLWIYDFVEKHELEIACWAFDPWNSSLFMTTVSERGNTVYDVAQTYSGLNDATVGLREDVYEGNVFYLKNPVLNFAMRNAVTRKSDGRIKIDKDATTKRVDPVDALICSYKLARTVIQESKSQKSYEEEIDAWLNADW